jgi:hypothetical protein
MDFVTVCFGGAEQIDAFVELRVGGVQPSNCKWVHTKDLATFEWPQDTAQTYFGPALRGQRGSLDKANFKCAAVCWVDVDNLERPTPILPPTAVVFTGNGYHFYWRLTRWTKNLKWIEHVNKAFAAHIGGDDAFDATRIMRVPNTFNTKDPDNPKRCKILELEVERVYAPDLMLAVAKLDAKTVRRVLTGDKRGFRSRSERDWAIIVSLVDAGFDDETIFAIFRAHACGDKYRDPREDSPDKYLTHSIRRARAGRQDREKAKDGGLGESPAGYYRVTTRGGKQQISTFTLVPKLLLEGESGAEDAILCDVKAAGTDFVWEDEVFPVSAFGGSHALRRQLKKAAWVWLGKDADAASLQVHLIQQLQAMGVPRAVATSVLGRHTIPSDPRTFYVSNDCTMASDGSFWSSMDAPIVYVEPDREVPRLNLTNHDVDRQLLSEIARTLPRVNTPGVIWPLIGWFMATPMKLAIEELGYRFPTLNIFGTRGSGKTTTVIRIFHPLLGYAEERSYDANTTRFVSLTLLGSTNAVPVAFSEFRIAQAESFTRYVLLAYDTGRDPRGRADQTTVDYPLLAPFSIDGEDMLEDPASLERITAVRTIPATIGEGTPAWAAHDTLGTLGNLGDFATPYLMYTLQADIGAMLDQAEQELWDAFPESLPPRIRRNLTVVWLGVLTFAGFMQRHGVHCFPKAGAEVLRTTLDNVYSISLGRAPTEADSFVEVVVNAAARRSRLFPWQLEGHTLWFQLTPAFEFYVSQRAHQRRSTLSRMAIKTQLTEMLSAYMVSPQMKSIQGRQVLAYGIDLHRAHNAGLDVPSDVTVREITIDLSD